METTIERTTIAKYPAYKYSGADWLGEVPKHWKVLPGFRIVNEGKEKNTGLIETVVLSLSYGNVIIKPEEKLTGLVPESFETYQIVNPGDIIIRPTDLQNDKTSLRTGLVKDRGIITSAYLNLKVKEEYSNKFYHYYLHNIDVTKVIYSLGSGLRQNLDYSDFKRFPFLVPPPEEQTAIADFLDSKTEQIDHAIAQKEKQIELLKERRQILIHRAVTRGLDPNIPLKDSGIEWIGQIPEHWEVKRLKYVVRILKRIANSLGYDVLSITQRGIKVKDIESGEGQLAMDYSKYQLLYRGEFAMNHMDLLTGYIDISNFDGVTSPDYRVFICTDEKVDKEYLLRLFQICYKSRIFYKYGQGVSQLGRWRFPAENFNNFLIPIPTIDEQNAIVDFVSNVESNTQKSILIKEKEILMLKEYKNVLINEAVTGKTKVN